MTDEAVREALARAQAPVTVTVPERWMLNVALRSLEAEERKLEGQRKRAKDMVGRDRADRALEMHRQTLDAFRAMRDATKTEA